MIKRIRSWKLRNIWESPRSTTRGVVVLAALLLFLKLGYIDNTTFGLLAVIVIPYALEKDKKSPAGDAEQE